MKIKSKCSLLTEKENVAYAALNLNPLVTWIKFILTDDKPNKNGNRVPKEEFPNLIKTGIYMPVKVANFDSDFLNHADAYPIGTITHLKEEGDKVIGLAALWDTERSDDVKEIKKAISEGQEVNLSWEIAYEDIVVEDDGVEALRGVSLLGTTIVDVPAYAGRTPILAVAEVEESEKWSVSYINSLPDSAFLYIEPGGKKDKEGKTVPRNLRHFPYKDKDGNIDVPHLRNALSRLGQSDVGKGWLTEELRKKLINKAKKILAKVNKEDSEMEEELRAELEQLKAAIKELEEKNAEQEKELEELRNYKAEVEAAKAEVEKLALIKEKFEAAGIEKPEEYFDENRERLLSMSEEAIDFMLQEMVVALAEKKESKQANSSADLPDFTSTEDDPYALAKALIKKQKK